MGRLQPDVLRPPVFVSAGVIKHEQQIVQAAGEQSVALQIIGSFTEPEWAGNSQRGTKTVFHWDEQNRAAYNSIGLENPGRRNASEYLPRALRGAKAAGQLAVISVTTLKGEDPLVVLPGLVEWALEMGADGVEINGSCPNLDPQHALLCHDVQQTLAVIGAVRERVGEDPTIGLKVSELGSHVIRSYKSHSDFDVDFVDAINTKGNQLSPTNPLTKQPHIQVNDGLAGMSGPAIKSLARDNLALWLRPKQAHRFDLLSSGGVDSSSHAGQEIYSRHAMGALLVGGAQEFYRKDIGHVARRWAEGYYNALPEQA